MRKFKVEEEVKVRDDLKIGNKYDGIIATAGMVSLKGKKLTIVYIRKTGIYKVAENSYNWSESMLEKIEENKGYFQVGDIIKGKKNNGYTVTNQDMYKGEVVDIYINKNKIKIKVLEHKVEDFEGNEYKVGNSNRYFEYYDKEVINVGDKVKWGDLKCTVEYITLKKDFDFESKIYLILTEASNYYAVPEEELSLIKEPKFEIGQEVRYSLYSHSYLIKDIYYDEKTNIYKYVVISKRGKSIRLFDEMNLKSIN
ncbi:MAG: hypothetical protein ACOC2W_03085 [bacterium]